jgi:arginine repressor
LAKKRTPAATPRKSDVIREILKSQPKATVKEVRAALQERGVKASDALINKIKYGRKTSGKKTRSRGANGSSGTKADAIRGVFGEMGAKARARDVVATLAARGIKVTSAQVSTLRKTIDSRRGKASTAYSVSLDHLMAAKALAQRLGGIAVAQRALESLAKLTDV